jgi:hypothetical protein
MRAMLILSLSDHNPAERGLDQDGRRIEGYKTVHSAWFGVIRTSAVLILSEHSLASFR